MWARFVFGLSVHRHRHQHLQFALRAMARRRGGGAVVEVGGRGSDVQVAPFSVWVCKYDQTVRAYLQRI